jgi:hypothetical protein
MTKIKIEVEFEIDETWTPNSEDQEEREWFWNEIIPSCMVILHSNEVGDTISEATSFTITQITGVDQLDDTNKIIGDII